MIRQVTQAGFTVLILVAALYAGAAAAHGRVAMEADPCMRRVGGSMVHFSTYQPQHAPSAQYCTEIPKEGDTLLVVDLVDPALRNVPVGVRVVEGINGTEDQTVAYLRPSYHPDGVVRGEARLDKGLYMVIITAEGRNPLRYQYPLRVQMIDYSRLARSTVGPLIGLLLLALLAHKLMRSKRLRSWWSSLRS